MRFGLIADLQYADADDGSNYDKTSIRRYRQSLDICREALRSFAVDSVETVVTLGDLLDGRARKLGKHHQGARDLVEAFIGEEVAVFSVIGNHDLYNFTRTEILSNHRDYIAKAKLPESVASAYCRYSDSLCPGKMYGSFTPTHGFRFIFLDGFDVSCVESSSTTNSDEAWTFLSTRNPNITDRHNLYNCDFNKNLGAGERHFVPYNGAVSRAQVDWLRDELRQADSEGESVFVFCHVPTHPGCCKQSCLLWNYEEVRR
jgi:manganese-dependent ADP-ribose/CDP-alcohol diphosphatase